MSVQSKIKNVLKLLYSSKYRWIYMANHGMYDSWDDEKYIKKYFECVMNKKLNLDHPRTFNEKLQWLKLHDRNPEYIKMVDKYLAKKYVASIIGEEHIIPTLGVWDKVEDIDFDKLPNRFVLKCNHNSGLGICICKDKSRLNIPNTRAILNMGLRQNYYLHGREWPYKYIERKIIAEEYMEDNCNNENLTDYKLMCFNGKVRCSFTCTNRFSKGGLKVTFFDNNWNRMPFERHYPAEDRIIRKPRKYEEMVKMAEKLSKKIPFVRIDFYEINGKVYFGEMTFYPGNGMEEFTPNEWDEKLGEWIKLPN